MHKTLDGLRWVRPNSWIALLAWLIPIPALGQDALDQAVDAMRNLESLSANDEERIAEWVQAQFTQLSGKPESERAAVALNEFRQKFQTQFEHKDNKPVFKTQFAAQTAAVAARRFAGGKQDRSVAVAMARILADMNRVETLPGLLAGLKSTEPAARLLSAAALSKLKSAIATEKDKIEQAVAALRDAGAAEPVPAVMTEIYLALAYPGQVPAVFDAYMSIFDKRLAARRASSVSDGAEVYAFEFFRTPTVIAALSDAQKAQLAKFVAVFLRLDAERYNASRLSFDEMDRIERQLDAEEDILAVLSGKNGKVREELAGGGHDRRAEILAQAYMWVGNPESKEPGIVSAPPLSVPVGAP